MKAVTDAAGRHRRHRGPRRPTSWPGSSSRGRRAALCVAPARRRPRCSTELVWEHRTAVLTSATIPPGLAEQRRPRPRRRRRARRRQPLRLRRPRPPLLRRPPARPPPARLRGGAARGAAGAHHRRRRAHPRPVHQLPGHAGRGRRPPADAGHAGPRSRATCPSPRSPPAFADDEATCLFATLSFWQGVDVPGRSLSLVTIDRLPFPRPDEPLLQARREQARADAFATVDLPRAATLLAQGAGRLIRTLRPTGAWSPCSTPAWPTPPTAGRSSTPCPRCAAPATAPKPKPSSRSSPRRLTAAATGERSTDGGVGPALTDVGWAETAPSVTHRDDSGGSQAAVRRMARILRLDR